MVWFQCEDCGEDLKKPKLPNHFRMCSANRLSCIDCGEVFGQQSVQSHTQCITEAEKYGPKSNGKPLNGTQAKPNKESKLDNIDINAGLSERPPWFCSLCNTKATSRQTLLLHAEGKKHRAKARAFHAKQQGEESTAGTKVPSENVPNGDSIVNGTVKESETVEVEVANADASHQNSEADNGKSLSKKRKLESHENNGEKKVIQVLTAGETAENQEKKAKHDAVKEDKVLESTPIKDEVEKKIKWKKLIKSALKSNPDGVLRMKELKKLVLNTPVVSRMTDDKTKLSDMLEQKIKSSSRFTYDNKRVRLVAKD